MTNPFKTQMDKIKTKTDDNTTGGDNTSTSYTQSSDLFNRRRKDNKQIYSVKLQNGSFNQAYGFILNSSFNSRTIGFYLFPPFTSWCLK